MKTAPILLMLIAAALALSGCETPPSASSATSATQPQLPRLSYSEVAARFNANVKKIDRVWSRAVVEIHWLDGKKKKFEQGEGNLILMLPCKVAFSIGKLGNVMVWAGSDLKRYWLMDLREDRVAYIGGHANAELMPPDDLPVPVQPLELVRLLGIAAISPDASEASARTEQGNYLLEPPGEHCRMWIDGKTFRASRIELLDDKGATRIDCRLTAYEPLELENQPPGAWPHMATKLAITVAPRGQSPESRMSIFLSDLTDGRADDKISDKAFEFESLKRIFKVEKVVDVDSK